LRYFKGIAFKIDFTQFEDFPVGASYFRSDWHLPIFASTLEAPQLLPCVPTNTNLKQTSVQNEAQHAHQKANLSF